MDIKHLAFHSLAMATCTLSSPLAWCESTHLNNARANPVEQPIRQLTWQQPATNRPQTDNLNHGTDSITNNKETKENGEARVRATAQYFQAPIRQPTKNIKWQPSKTNKVTEKLAWEIVQEDKVIYQTSSLQWTAATEPIPLPKEELSQQTLIMQKAWPAYSRGSLIQIGNIIYPNLGFNALQREPSSWGNAAIAAIDNSFQSYKSASQCSRGDFSSGCADGLAEIYVRLWNSKDFSLDLQWTIHSLSGGKFSFADRTGGTPFGEGQSLGFKLSKNITPTFGLTFGANRLIHLDQTTDLPKNLYLMGTKVIRTSNKPDAPIFSISLGLMSDVYNPNTNLTTAQYPKWLLGGEYPSIFAEYFDKRQATSGRGYYPNVAGTSSAFVCADQSIFAFKPISAANPNCIKQVYIGPVGSIGFAPWPWLGFYAIYEGNLNLGISVKPFTNIPWTISLQAVQPFSGINPRDDAYISEYPCAGQDLSTCRTRIGLFTDLSF